MAKTQFVKGTKVSSAFLNSIFLTAGGHIHDGGDVDGHAPKISLSNAAHVTGVLPIANAAHPLWFALFTHTGGRVTTSPAPVTFEEGPGLSAKSHILGPTSGEKMVIMSGRLWFKANANINYIRIALPAGHRPAGFYIYDQPFTKVACVSYNSGTYTDIEGIYAAPARDDNDGYLYIGNKELAWNLPASVSFAANISYSMAFSLIYNLYQNG